MIREEIPTALAGERLDRVVALIADVSRATASRLVAEGSVYVDGTMVVVGRTRVAAGQIVDVEVGSVVRVTGPAADAGVEFGVVFVDDDVIVVDKPAGLVVHPAPGSPDQTLVNGLLARFPEVAEVGEAGRPGIVHRLDAGSSGLLVVARSPQAYERLVTQFATRTVSRRYRALVWGHPAAVQGIIDAPIGRDHRDPARRAVVTDGKAARTAYEVLESFEGVAEVALLECTLETGRTHQIRVHLMSIGHPLVGDPVYGAGRPTLGLARPFLHAIGLSFDHPVSGERMSFSSELPTDLADVLARVAGST